MWNNLVVTPSVIPSAGPACFHALSSTRNVSSAHTHFFNNTCILQSGDYPYNCGAGPSPFYNKSYHVDVHQNRFCYLNTTSQPAWTGACGCWPPAKTGAGPCPFATFSDWQRYGHDKGSTVVLQPSNAEVLAQARGLLGLL